jgi:protein-S-isoprenylcysteine O-methyltransferase Ste14
MTWSGAHNFVIACWTVFGLLQTYTFAHARLARAATPTGRKKGDSAMLGLFVQTAGAMLAVYGGDQSAGAVRLWCACLLAPLSTLLAWRGAVELGRHFRIQALVTDDHALVTTGPFSLVRHPIYTGLFGLTLATGLVRVPWPRLIIGAVLFLLGTEIRVRIEERLLTERFPEAAREYQSRVKAYIPFVR